MNDPIFISNEPESQENPRYLASRLISGDVVPEGKEVKDVPPPKDNPTYIAYKAEEVPRSESGGGLESNNSKSSEWINSGPIKSATSEYIPKP